MYFYESMTNNFHQLLEDFFYMIFFVENVVFPFSLDHSDKRDSGKRGVTVYFLFASILIILNADVLQLNYIIGTKNVMKHLWKANI